jgi:hypothetical protein
VKKQRSVAEVTNDLLFPGGISAQPGTEIRLYAVVEVLQRIPKKAYTGLLQKFAEFVWFIPGESAGAMVMPFP